MSIHHFPTSPYLGAKCPICEQPGCKKPDCVIELRRRRARKGGRAAARRAKEKKNDAR